MGSGHIGYGRARVWEWTESETSDGHTRSSVIKGGSGYQAFGSEWYADGGTFSPDWCAKFIRWGPPWTAAPRSGSGAPWARAPARPSRKTSAR